MADFFSAHDGTKLAYHTVGEGRPVVCLPGGMQASAYLGDLGGLSAHRQLVMLDLRGTGRSPAPEDAAAYRCDRLVEDVEALREHLGLDRVDLLAHSGGANLALLYAARHPERVGRLALITPSVFAVGIEIAGDDRLAAAKIHQDEPWFAAAYAALESVVSGTVTADAWQAMSPLQYGRWDEVTQAHKAAEEEQRNYEAAAAYAADGAFDPDATRTALARFESPVLLLAGEADMGAPPRAMAELAGLFPNAELVIQRGAAHFPWLYDADRFVEATAAFLS
jgi:pimeloyl-ACP methyl ester carboxylesterase